jgi:hypothetical protein
MTNCSITLFGGLRFVEVNDRDTEEILERFIPELANVSSSRAVCRQGQFYDYHMISRRHHSLYGNVSLKSMPSEEYQRTLLHFGAFLARIMMKATYSVNGDIGSPIKIVLRLNHCLALGFMFRQSHWGGGKAKNPQFISTGLLAKLETLRGQLFHFSTF